MKNIATMALLLVASVTWAQNPLKVTEPQMSKAPPTDLEKALAKLSPAKLPVKKSTIKTRQKPGAEIGMTAEQVVRQTNWGRPQSIQRIVNADGVWEWWYYLDDQAMLFLNGELYEIDQNETCN